MVHEGTQKRSHKTSKTDDNPKTMRFFTKTIFQHYSLIETLGSNKH